MNTEQPYTPSEDELIDGWRRKKVTHDGWTYHPTLSRTEIRAGLAQVRRDAAREAQIVTLASAGHYAVQITVRNGDEPLHLDYVDRDALAQQLRELADMLTEEETR